MSTCRGHEGGGVEISIPTGMFFIAQNSKTLKCIKLSLIDCIQFLLHYLVLITV